MKKIIFSLLVLLVLVVSGCENIDISKLSDEDLGRIAEKAIVCNEPYIRFGTSCCLDKDSNSICDRDERELTEEEEEKEDEIVEETELEEVGEEEEEEEAEGCNDECSSDSCSGFDYTECLMKSDGCKDKSFRGKIKGKCGVECTTDNDCDSDEKCENYKCVGEGEEPTVELEVEEEPEIEEELAEWTDEDLANIERLKGPCERGNVGLCAALKNQYNIDWPPTWTDEDLANIERLKGPCERGNVGLCAALKNQYNIDWPPTEEATE